MPSARRCGSPSIRKSGDGCTRAMTEPAPGSPELSVAMVCGAFGAPGQNGQWLGWLCFSVSSPTMTQERVIGSLRNSICVIHLHLGKHPLGKASIALPGLHSKFQQLRDSEDKR